MENNFKILSLNVNGLNDPRKRRLALKYFKTFRKSIILLQETHCKRGCARLWRSQWPGSMLLSEGSRNQGGVAILFSRDLKPSISNVYTHIDERFIVADIELENRCFKIASVYMPTSDHENRQIEILGELEEALEDDQGSDLFVGGDFNVAMHPELDRQGYVRPQIHNTSFRGLLIQFLDRLDLLDAWRIQNTGKRNFSWSRAHKMARLDYIFASSSFLGILKAQAPISCSFSDHRLLSLMVKPKDVPRGKGFWRMQTWLLERKDFRLRMREFLAVRIADSLLLPHDTRWEFIKLGIREMTNSAEAAEEYHAVKRELLQIQLLVARQAMLRSRTKWLGQGERPTSYFLNLEKRQYNEKTISSIYNEEGTLLTTQEDILKYEKDHYQKQHSPLPQTHADGRRHPDPFCAAPQSTLKDLDRDVLNDALSLEELERAAKSMHNGKSPGTDGIPIEFYKKILGLTGPPPFSIFSSFS